MRRQASIHLGAVCISGKTQLGTRGQIKCLPNSFDGFKFTWFLTGPFSFLCHSWPFQHSPSTFPGGGTSVLRLLRACWRVRFRSAMVKEVMGRHVFHIIWVSKGKQPPTPGCKETSTSERPELYKKRCLFLLELGTGTFKVALMVVCGDTCVSGNIINCEQNDSSLQWHLGMQ